MSFFTRALRTSPATPARRHRARLAGLRLTALTGLALLGAVLTAGPAVAAPAIDVRSEPTATDSAWTTVTVSVAEAPAGSSVALDLETDAGTLPAGTVQVEAQEAGSWTAVQVRSTVFGAVGTTPAQPTTQLRWRTTRPAGAAAADIDVSASLVGSDGVSILAERTAATRLAAVPVVPPPPQTPAPSPDATNAPTPTSTPGPAATSTVPTRDTRADAPKTAAAKRSSLARTGIAVGAGLTGALVLVLAGCALLRFARARRAGQDAA